MIELSHRDDLKGVRRSGRHPVFFGRDTARYYSIIPDLSGSGARDICRSIEKIAQLR